jgi:L-fucose isomerase
MADAVERVTGHKLEGAAAGGFLHLINSGSAALDGTGDQSVDGKPAMKPFWEITDEEVSACLKATTWHPSITEYFPAGGMSTRYKTKGGMSATMCRINLVKGHGPVLQIAEGETIALPENVHDILDERTNPTWPTTWFVPKTGGNGVFRDVYSVMNAWGANHCAMSYGHIGADATSRCRSFCAIFTIIPNLQDGRNLGDVRNSITYKTLTREFHPSEYENKFI